MLGMMPRKSAFNFAKGKKQLSVPQHSAAFLLVIFWSLLQAPQRPRALPEGSLAPQRSAVQLRGHPLGKVLLFPRPHSIFSMKKTARGSCFPPHWLKLYGLVMSLAEWQRDGPNQKRPAQQSSTSLLGTQGQSPHHAEKGALTEMEHGGGSCLCVLGAGLQTGIRLTWALQSASWGHCPWRHCWCYQQMDGTGPVRVRAGDTDMGKELFRGAGPAFHTVQAPQFTCERTGSPTRWESVL